MLNEIDIAIIGGGNAGLTLAAQLAQQASPPRTLIIEPRPPEQRDCSWGLWAKAPQIKQLERAALGRWPRWQLIDHDQRVIHHSRDYSYLSLSAARYLQDCASRLREPVSLVQESVNSLQADGDQIRVETDKQCYRASQVYDSRPPKIIENGLRQHFLGWHIQTNQPIAETDIATLMDFRVDQSRGLHFIYALPFSDHQMLVESTLISRQIEPKEWYQQAIEGWLQTNGIEVDLLLSEEVGVIPMDKLAEDHLQSPSTDHAQIASIGAASGAVRRSSGYAFQHIQQQMRALAAGIANGDRRVPAPIANRLTAMDNIFNGVLLSRPDLAVSLYMRMAKALNGDQFARFMLGQASTADWLRVIAAMPKMPFLRQLLHV